MGLSAPGGGRSACYLGNCLINTRASRKLNQPQALHARMSIFADDDVVMHRDPQRLGRVDDHVGHVDIGA